LYSVYDFYNNDIELKLKKNVERMLLTVYLTLYPIIVFPNSNIFQLPR